VNLTEYQSWTVKTSLYPGVGSGSPDAISYATLGLVGEAGEMEEASQAVDRFAGRAISSPDFEPFLKEVGDFLFYAARLCAELGLDLASLWTTERDGAWSTPFLTRIFRVVEVVKKHVRGDYGREECARRIAQPLGQILAHANFFLLGRHCVEAECVIGMNVEKLEARLAKGSIRGNGSER
jgi:NTP pyrophosphatase (non-canonical NTP hydrolase)